MFIVFGDLTPHSLHLHGERYKFSMCKYSRDCFCFICAYYVPQKERFRITKDIKRLFFRTYHFKMLTDELCQPTSVCYTCKLSMHKVLYGTRSKLEIASPAIFFKCKPDHSDCLFCLARPELAFGYLPINVSVLEPIFN